MISEHSNILRLEKAEVLRREVKFKFTIKINNLLPPPVPQGPKYALCYEVNGLDRA